MKLSKKEKKQKTKKKKKSEEVQNSSKCTLKIGQILKKPNLSFQNCENLNFDPMLFFKIQFQHYKIITFFILANSKEWKFHYLYQIVIKKAPLHLKHCKESSTVDRSIFQSWSVWLQSEHDIELLIPYFANIFRQNCKI